MYSLRESRYESTCSYFFYNIAIRLYEEIEIFLIVYRHPIMHDGIPSCLVETESRYYENSRYDSIYPDIMIESYHISIREGYNNTTQYLETEYKIT